MKVEVEINGHQYYRMYQGELLSICSTAIRHEQQFMQVPCAVVESEGEIIVQPLTEYMKVVKVKYI